MTSLATRSRSAACLTASLWLLVPGLVQPQSSSAGAVDVPTASQPEPAPAEHESGQAGEPYQTEILGEQVNIEARDRGDTMAVALGATLYAPKIGDTQFSPLGSFYYLGDWEDEHRLRAQISGLVNDLEFAQRFHGFEAIVRLGNDDRRLFGEAETVSGEELDDTELKWGYETLWLGPGWALDISPFNVDNQLRIQLFYRGEYQHFNRTDQTSPDIAVPLDTWVHGPSLRVRHDALQRNLLELPQSGYAFGLDAEFLRRDRWNQQPAAVEGHRDPLTELGDRNFMKLRGYVVGASRLPWLSDRHGITGQIHLGWAPQGTLDRYSGFRVGGGPLPREADDLIRLTYPGALFDQFIADEYVLATASYRYELTFFMYLRASITLFQGRIVSIEESTGNAHFRSLTGEVPSVALVSGFFWDSTLEVEYDYDTRLVRGDRGGSQVLVMWSKAF